jgi:23S rRNA (pseudouridine1915-N3)-methyltransferase
MSAAPALMPALLARAVKILLYYIGKPKDPHANALAADYCRRSAHYTPCQMIEIKPDRFDPWAKHPSATKILLDPAGRSFDSNAFADLFAKGEMLGRDLVFVVGGHDGLPPAWTPRADLLLSLSAMTMPHELARAVLAEQIYRAFTILRGHPYPR